MPSLLLPGTRDFLLASTAMPYRVGLTINHSVRALYTIESLWKTLCALNSEVTHVAWMAWMDDEEIKQVREALERTVADGC